jgi:hypothetical protein
MKRLLLLLTLCFPVLLFSQQAVTSAGGIGIGGTSSFSLGQVAYSSFNIIGVGSINEGVLQPPPPLSLTLNRTNVTCNGGSDATASTYSTPDPLDVTMVVTDVSCNGGSDGTITATATGGVPPYYYKWVGFPDDTTSTITGLPARSLKYKVIVTDSGMNEEKRKRKNT